MDKRVRVVGYFAHVWRNFVKVIQVRGKGATNTGGAEVALRCIGKLYALIKGWAADRDSPPPALFAFCKEKAEGILDDFKSWMANRAWLTPPKGLVWAGQ